MFGEPQCASIVGSPSYQVHHKKNGEFVGRHVVFLRSSLTKETGHDCQISDGTAGSTS
jgi:hypothetical protein